MPLHALLYRNDAGDIAIRWSRLLWWLAVYALGSVLVGLALEFFVGTRFRAAHTAFITVVAAIPSVLLLYVAKRQAEGKSATQFGLSALLAGAAVACVLFALLGSDRRSQLANYAKREQLEEALVTIVGHGDIYVSGTTLIQVKRASFDDDDLQKILRLREQLDDVDSPLTFLDLSGTSVTDLGVGELKNLESLEYCFLDGTGVTDLSIDTLSGLSKLRLISVVSTRVTPERLLTLSLAQPRLNIEPKAYLKLISQ